MEYPENLVPIVIPDGWLELRIHGVSGTPPEDLLRGHAVRVAGDEMSGFYRIEGVNDLEAYSWGGLTSGKKRHAFWLLLLPFSLINVVGWMTPCPMTEVGRRIHAAFSRLIALAATALTTLFAAVLILDLGAWRPPAPVDEPGWLKTVTTWWVAVPPNVRMAIGTLLVALVVIALGLISRQTRRAYESTDGDHPVTRDPAPTTSLEEPVMWGTSIVGDFLGPIHSGLALGVCSWVASWVEAGSWTGPGLLGAALILYSVALVGALAFEPEWVTNRNLSRFLPPIGLAAVVWAFFHVLGATLAPTSAPLEPPIAGFTWMVLVVVALLGGLVILGRPWNRPGNRGHGYALAAIALSALTATGSGAVLALEGLFERERTITDAFDWLAILFTVALSIVLTWVLFRWDPLGPRGGEGSARTTARFQRLHETVREGRNIVALWGFLLLLGFLLILIVGYFTSDPPPSGILWLRLPPLPGQPGSPEFYTYAAWALLALPLVSVLYSLVRHLYLGALVALAVSGVVVWSIWKALPSGGTVSIDISVVTVAGYVGLLLPAAGILFLIVKARSDRNLRQSVGIIWDLANFWPRWYHPWAAPPYSEISIPALRGRIEALITNGHKVVISAHSQGAVLSVPVILQPPAFVQHSYAFLTYGCLIGTVYKDLFPQYFSDTCVMSVNVRVKKRWRNLYRLTDPLGDVIEHIASVVPVLSSVDGIDSVLNHSNYQYSPEYQTGLKELVQPAESTVDTRSATPLFRCSTVWCALVRAYAYFARNRSYRRSNPSTDGRNADDRGR